jgi:hypothetical protein
MSLNEWHKNGWVKPHATSKDEISNLFEIVVRDLKDAKTKQLSDDWKFGIAYNAALKLCTILLYCSGFKPEKNLAHYRTLQSLPLILGSQYSEDADFLDYCRKKRNETEYNFAGNISDDEVTDLIAFTDKLKEEVLKWLKSKHRALLP